MKKMNINELIVEYRENRDNEVFNQILKQVEKTIYKIINPFTNKEKEEDLYQEAIMGLLKSINIFDLNCETKFNTLAYKCMANEVYMYLRKNQKYQHTVVDKEGNFKYTNMSTDEVMSNTEDNLTIADTLVADVSVEGDIIASEESKMLYDLIDKFANKNETRKQIMYLVLQDNLTQEEISQRCNCARSYVSRTQKAFVDYARKIVA